MTQNDDLPLGSLNHEFYATVKRHRHRVAFERLSPAQAGEVTFGEMLDRVEAFAAGLLHLGLHLRGRVALVADNRLDWFVADRGTLMAGGVDVPQPRDIGGTALLRILRHSGSRIAVVEGVKNRQQIQQWAVEGLLPRLHHVVRFVEEEEEAVGPVPELGFGRLLDLGRSWLMSSPDAVLTVAARSHPDSLATIVYTSGTTGSPKGVVLTHGNILHNIRVIPGILDLNARDRYLSILPAWHMFERTLEYILLHCGATVIYTSRRRIKADLKNARPTITALVPRILEMIYQDIQKKVQGAGGLRRALARLSFAVSRARGAALSRSRGFSDDTACSGAAFRRLQGLFTSALLALPHALLDPLVNARIRQALGPTLRMAVSGGGALAVHIDEMLNALGFSTLVGYGLTETSPVVSVRTHRKNVIGTIGLPIPETEVEIRDAGGDPVGPDTTGLVFIRGPQVMRGYFRDHALARQVLTSDGWFNSGDLGSIRPDGEIRITGRAKDTIVLLSGENVEPLPLETSILRSPYIDQAMVMGQDMKELCVLVVPDSEAIAAFVRDSSLPGTTLEDWIDHRPVQDLLQSEIRARTSVSEGFSSFEKVNRVHLLSRPFSIEDGTLTHTLKLRRNVVMERYAGVFGPLRDLSSGSGYA